MIPAESQETRCLLDLPELQIFATSQNFIPEESRAMWVKKNVSVFEAEIPSGFKYILPGSDRLKKNTVLAVDSVPSSLPPSSPPTGVYSEPGVAAFNTVCYFGHLHTNTHTHTHTYIR